MLLLKDMPSNVVEDYNKSKKIYDDFYLEKVKADNLIKDLLFSCGKIVELKTKRSQRLY